MNFTINYIIIKIVLKYLCNMKNIKGRGSDATNPKNEFIKKVEFY